MQEMNNEVNNSSVYLDILLVEDNPKDAELTIKAIEKRRLINSIIWLKDGAEAMDYFFGISDEEKSIVCKTIDLILLDLKLPKINGHELLHRLKEDPVTRFIPVVILTSSREEADILNSYKERANSYFVKPVDFEKFADAVWQLGIYWLMLNQHPGMPHKKEKENDG